MQLMILVFSFELSFELAIVEAFSGTSVYKNGNHGCLRV